MPADELEEIENELRNRGQLPREAQKFGEKSLAEKSPAIAASIYGATKGAQLASGGLIPKTAGAVMGAAIGGFGGEAALETAKGVLGYEDTDPITRGIEAGGEMGFGEGLMRTVLGGGGLILRPFASRVTPHAQSLIKYMTDKFDRVIGLAGGVDEAARAIAERVPGAPVSPSMIETVAEMGVQPATATGSRLQNVLTGVSEGAMIGGRRPAAFNRTQGGLLELVKEDLGSQFGKAIDKADLGEAVIQSINGNINHAKAAIDTAWNQVENLGTGASINLRSLHKTRLGLKVRDVIQRMGDNVDLPVALRLREKLAKVGDPSAQQAISILDRQLRVGARRVSADAADAVGYALKLEGGMADKYGDKFIQGLIKAHGSAGPRAVAHKILASGDYTLFNKVFNAVDGATADQIKAGLLADLVESSVINGEVRAAPLRQSLNKIGDKTLRKVLGNDTAKDVNRFLEVLDLIQSGKTAAKPGKTAIMLMQASPLIGFGTNALNLTNFSPEEISGSTALLMLGPEFIGQMLTRRGGARLLTRSLTMPATAQLAPSIASRLAAEKSLQTLKDQAYSFTSGMRPEAEE